MRRIWLFVLAVTAALATPSIAWASWPDAVQQRVRGLTPSVPTSFEAVVALLGTPDARGPSLAGEAGADGHWRLVNREGETISAATPAELSHAFRQLLGPVRRDGQLPVTLFLTDDSLFRYRAALDVLPAGLRVRVLLAGEIRPVLRVASGGQSRYYVEVGRRLIAEAKDRATFDEVMRQLRRPLAERPIRLLALEPDSKVVLSPARRLEPARGAKATERPVMYEPVDPDALRRSFAVLSGSTAVIVGRIDGERLVYQTGTGAERNLILSDFTKAASAADVDLIVVRSPTARQPGTRNWLWLQNDIAGLDASLSAPTLGGMLTGLLADEGRIAVGLVLGSDGLVRLNAQPLERVGRNSPLDPLVEVLTDLVSSITGTSQVTSIEAHLVGSARRLELAARLLPGIPAMAQVMYFTALLLALPGLAVLRQWWAGVWPAEDPKEYGGLFGWIAARILRAGAFVAVFMPLLGPSAVIWQLARFAAALVGSSRRAPLGAGRNPAA